MRQPRSEREEIKAQPTHLVRNTEESQIWPRTFPNAIDRQIQTNLYLFFFFSKWMKYWHYWTQKQNSLFNSACNSSAGNELSGFQAFLLLGNTWNIHQLCSRMPASLFSFPLGRQKCSSFHAAAFIYILNKRVIIFPLPPSGPPFCSLSSPCFLTCSC